MTAEGGPALAVAARARRVDLGLSALLILQGLTLFVAIPLAGTTPAGRALLDGCHLAFAVICIGVLTRRRLAQVALLAALVLLVARSRVKVPMMTSASSRLSPRCSGSIRHGARPIRRR